jgi:hypothetical protein
VTTFLRVPISIASRLANPGSYPDDASHAQPSKPLRKDFCSNSSRLRRAGRSAADVGVEKMPEPSRFDGFEEVDQVLRVPLEVSEVL